MKKEAKRVFQSDLATELYPDYRRPDALRAIRGRAARRGISVAGYELRGGVSYGWYTPEQANQIREDLPPGRSKAE